MNEKNTADFDLFVESVKNFAKGTKRAGVSLDIEIKETHQSTEKTIPSVAEWEKGL